MGQINIRKRGVVYQYSFEIAKIDGKRKQVSKSGFRTKAEAQENGTKAYNEYINTGVDFKENNISYSDYLDYWLKNYCYINLKYNTIQSYITIIEKYLKPNLGKYRLTSLSSVSLNTFIVELCKRHDFSKAYFSNILKVLKGSFREACNLYGFLKYNPAITLRLPKIDKRKENIKHLYTKEEIELILNRFKDNETFTCAFLTSCYTGMRTGEVFGLTWEDIDFENRTITISHNIYDKKKDKKGKWYMTTPKTEAGNRIIYMSNTLMIALMNFKKKQQYLKELSGKDYLEYSLEPVFNEYNKIVEYRIVKFNKHSENKINLVFTKANGLYCGTDIIKYPYKIIHNELGIAKCRFYDLRGTYATRILKRGIEIRDVADLLGHRNIETTENYYISGTKETKEEATIVFDSLMESDTINQILKYTLN